ncbi:MAG TPA: glutamate synthase-related protein, partial [Sphingomicrobium sp.]|nr:glutamate synthase-related protein [Sphingomicrobium sp.]
VQADGGIRTGRDVAVAAILGADEFGFATAPLIAAGCIMMRKCHLNTCPVGVATQDPVLRARFTGTPEHVINYFFFVAEELREIMASLGIRRVAEMIGRTELMEPRKAIDHWKAQGIDLGRLLHRPAMKNVSWRNSERQDHGLEELFDRSLIAAARPALERREPVLIERDVLNVHRSIGTMLSGEVARRFGHEGLPQDSIFVRLKGTAGQSLGAFLAHGVTLELTGDGNDYVGKGLSGGRVIVRQPVGVNRDPALNIIVGNTVLYGAIAGEAYFEGIAGERFAVRNSGAVAVVEGAGDHCCEYMTGGVVCVLGPVGRNFAAGMSGGIAYVYDPDRALKDVANLGSVALERVGPPGSLPSEGAPLQKAQGVSNSGMGHPLHHDAERLRILLERHKLATGSAKAEALQENWPDALQHFVKVVPGEYQRALTELEPLADAFAERQPQTLVVAAE